MAAQTHGNFLWEPRNKFYKIKEINVPNEMFNYLNEIGGKNFKRLQSLSQAQLQFIPDAHPNDLTWTLELMGTTAEVVAAEELIKEVFDMGEQTNSGHQQWVQSHPLSNWAFHANRVQQPSGSYSGPLPYFSIHNLRQPPNAGYPPQQPRYSANWNQHYTAQQQQNSRPRWGYGQPPSYGQQQGYGSAQPGSYSGPLPQYNTSQPSYPPRQPSGYSTNYTAQQQQNSQPGIYYRYHAPRQSGYGQPPSYGQQQGYGSTQPGSYSGPFPQYNTSRPGYPPQQPGGYSANYTAQQQKNSQPQQQSGYGQSPTYVQQQGYNTSLPGYPPQQVYATNQQPGSNIANYPPQGTTQPGYGVC